MDWMDRLEQYGEEKTSVNGDQPRIYEIPDDGSGIENTPDDSRPVYEDDGDGIE